jgi:hypothetical protein
VAEARLVRSLVRLRFRVVEYSVVYETPSLESCTLNVRAYAASQARRTRLSLYSAPRSMRIHCASL